MTDTQMTPEESQYWSEQAALADHRKRTTRQHSYHIQRAYGITLEQYEYQLAQQGGVCAICKDKPEKKRLSIDHDQKSKINRGLLCTRCNVGLGYFRDSVATLKAAILYIENFEKLIAPKLDTTA